MIHGRNLTRLEWWGFPAANLDGRCLVPGHDVRTTWSTAYVAYAMTRLGHDERARRIVAAARRHLEAERDTDARGAWAWHGTALRNFPPDVDDTSVPLLLLPPAPRDAATIEAMLANRDRSGGLRTWLPGIPSILYADSVDPSVNANVYTMLLARGVEDPALKAYLEDALRRRTYRRGTDFYPSPCYFLYATSAVAHGLSAEAVRDLDAGIAHWLPRVAKRSRLDASMLAVALANRGRADEAAAAGLFDRVLADQREDGGWDANVVFKGRVWWGARSIDTAFAVEALLGVPGAAGA